MFSTATPSLHQPTEKGNNFIIASSKYRNLYIAVIAGSAAGLTMVQWDYVLA